MKKQISFYSEKISNLYLMKIQTSFLFRKNFRYVFNENTDKFLLLKNFKSVFNENTYQFCCCCCLFFFFNINVFSNLLQILKFKVELNLKHVNQLLNNKLNM